MQVKIQNRRSLAAVLALGILASGVGFVPHAAQARSANTAAAPVVLAIPLVAEAIYAALMGVTLSSAVAFSNVPTFEFHGVRVAQTSLPDRDFKHLSLSSSNALAVKDYLNSVFAAYITALNTLEFEAEDNKSLTIDPQEAEEILATYASALRALPQNANEMGLSLQLWKDLQGLARSTFNIDDLFQETYDDNISIFLDQLSNNMDLWQLPCERGGKAIDFACNAYIETLVFDLGPYLIVQTPKKDSYCLALAKKFYQSCIEMQAPANMGSSNQSCHVGEHAARGMVYFGALSHFDASIALFMAKAGSEAVTVGSRECQRYNLKIKH